jgi:acetyl esterase/lipase
MTILVYVLSGTGMLYSLLLVLKPKHGGILLPAKIFASSLSPLWAFAGLSGFILGLYIKSYLAAFLGFIGGGWMLFYILNNIKGQNHLESAFGMGWSKNISLDQFQNMTPRPWSWYNQMSATPEPKWDRDVVYWTLPESGRQLLCDIWQPGDGNLSGLTFIYNHGSAWWVGDKDYHKTTRALFRHLVSQGHTVMDVAYRLCPEVQLKDMLADVKRAVFWMRDQASEYGVNPNKLVLAGGSAGAHLALLAGYTTNHPDLTPNDLLGQDLPVHAIVAYYPPIDLVEGFYRYNEFVLSKNPSSVTLGQTLTEKEKFEHLGRLDFLLGGHPNDVPEIYALASPLSHVSSHSPPTLLLQGGRDVLVPSEPVVTLHQKLTSLGVPSVCVIQPWTEHAYDLFLPQFSPPAQNSLYYLDRFLGILLHRP